MAVSVDTVYQRVLTLANKEQRGYITPQEFNLLANQAQMEILNQYFYDINQWGRQHGNDTEYSDMLNIIQEKLSELEVRLVGLTAISGIYNYRTNITNLYKLGSVHTTHPTNSQKIEIEEVNNNEWYTMQSAPLTRPNPSRPIYVNRQDGLNIYPDTIEDIDISYIRTPNEVEWGYFVINDKALYDSSLLKTTHFELHASEETELVYKILRLAGISIKQPEVVQVAAALDTAQNQTEKQ